MSKNTVSFNFFTEKEIGMKNFYKNNEEDSNHKKMLEVLKKIMAQDLTKRQKECVWFYFSENLKMKEIAFLLGLNVSSVSRHIKSAKNKIEKIMRYYW